MRVLLLGAGASKAAGYPVANGLMKAIEDDAANSKSDQLRCVWDRWLSIKNSAPDTLRILLEHNNPEIIFSVLDLCRTCFEDRTVPRFKEAAQTKQSPQRYPVMKSQQIYIYLLLMRGSTKQGLRSFGL
jgi:hypothetical protein